MVVRSTAKITLVQLTDNGDGEDALARMPNFFEQASDYGSDLIVFPEYILGHFIPIDHPRIGRFMELVAKHRMYAVAGFVEKHGEVRSTTAIGVDRAGNLLGRYYKCHPASGPAPHWWPPLKGQDCEARGILGSQFETFQLDFGTIGILQCYDGFFPEAWACNSYAGAEIILWINGRDGQIEDYFCMAAASAHGCVVAANISNGFNTGFAGPFENCVHADGEREPARLFPRIHEPGDACVHATIDLAELRWRRKHLRTAHQRRPELYGALTKNATIWKQYPDVPWDFPECSALVNRSQL